MPTHSNDLKYWSLLVIHQLSLTEGLHSALVEKEFIILLAKMTRLSFGNTNMQKLCLHSLVRLISNLDNQDLKMVSLLASCLRNDDLELVSWAVFLMQEFVMKDFARSSFSEVKGILKVLSNLLNTEDGMGIPRIVLRTLKCLAIRNEPFQLDMIKNNIVKKVIACLKVNDEETQYWALSLLHDLVGHAECHEEFLEGEGLKVLTDMATHPNLHISLYISDVFIFLCSGGKNSDHIENSDVLSSVFLFFKSSEPDLQYSGALLLLNLSALSDTMLIKIIDEGALIAIKDTLISTVREDIQAVLAKTLITIVRKKPNTCLLVLEDVLYPLVVRVNELFAEKGNASSLIGSLYTIQIILQSYALFKNFDLSESLSVQIQHLSFCVESVLCKRLVAIDILPNDLQDMLEFIPDMEEADPLLMKNIASRSVASLTAIYQLVPESLDTSKILKLLTALLRVDDELLSQVLMSLATIVSIDPHCRRKLVDYSLSAGLITSIMEKTNESIVKFYCQLLCDRLADFTNSLSFDNDGYLHLDRNSMTPYISLSHDCCEVKSALNRS
ncbi:armadillo-type protein [Chytridium lagenaria]|nr:armadillo-type protein [Chytridium lagenaria]